jgi:CDP-6-deoxy-D-xylo-4-hexulose-3-dehydrase
MKFADRAIELLNVEGNMDGNFKFLANRKTSFQAGVDSVYYSGPYWDHREIEAAIRSLLDGKWLTSGENVMKFEKSFSKRFGFSESVMVNSGSSANLVMLAALKKYFDWQDGDEIIVSAVGFPTTINPIIQNGLKPIFIDIDWADLNWDLEKLKFAITSRTRAVFSSPVLGNPYDFDKLLNILEGKEIKIISDNCDSLGSRWRGKFLTDYSIAASCSFYPAHHITTMEGGMISSIDEEIVKLARSFAWWGRACYCVGVQNLLPNGTCKKRFSNWIEDCEVIVDHKYVFENIGYNLKPLDLQGAVGVVQLEKFEEIHQMRRKNKELIAHAFERINGVKVLDELTHSETSWFGVPIVCSNSHLKTKLVQFLEENKIQTRNYFAGNILQQPAYRELGNYNSFPNANRVLSEVFFVGCSPTFTDDMLNYVESTLAKFAI